MISIQKNFINWVSDLLRQEYENDSYVLIDSLNQDYELMVNGKN